MSITDTGLARVSWLKWIDRLSTTLAVFGGAATVIMMLNIVFDVAGRFLLNRPLQGTLDLTQYTWMPALVSFGLGYALLKGEHLRVSLITAPTGQLTQRIIEIVGMAFSLLVVALFIWYGIEKAHQTMTLGEHAVGTKWLAIWPSRWVLVIGLTGLLLQVVAQLLRALFAASFQSSDDDEARAALEMEQTVFDDLADDDPRVMSPQPTAPKEAAR